MKRAPMLAMIGLLVSSPALGLAPQGAPVSQYGIAPTATEVEAITKIPSSTQILVADAANNSTAINIIEPNFKPPKTWTYDPDVVTVKVGATVTWVNTGAVAHTATSDDKKTFNSGQMRPKATYQFTMKAPGTFTYHCIYHPWMKATIVVQP